MRAQQKKLKWEHPLITSRKFQVSFSPPLPQIILSQHSIPRKIAYSLSLQKQTLKGKLVLFFGAQRVASKARAKFIVYCRCNKKRRISIFAKVGKCRSMFLFKFFVQNCCSYRWLHLFTIYNCSRNCNCNNWSWSSYP